MIGAPLTPAAALQQVAQASTPWGRLMGALALCGFVFAWYVQNLESATPALSSPPALIVSYFLAVAVGMALDHWFVARPRIADLSDQLARMRADIAAMSVVVNSLREEEGRLREDKGQKTAEIVELRTSLKFLRADLDEMRRLQNPAPGGARPRNKSKPKKGQSTDES